MGRFNALALRCYCVVQVGGEDEGDSDGKLILLEAVPVLGAAPLPQTNGGGTHHAAGSRMDEDDASERESSTLPLSESSLAAQEKHALVLIQLEAARRAKSIFVPTDNNEVKSALRAAGSPVTLFGEGPYERRSRLRQLLGQREMQRILDGGDLNDTKVSSSAAASAAAAAGVAAGAAAAETASKSEVFYTPASDGLQEARGFIAKYSFERAAKRLRAQSSVSGSAEAVRAEDEYASSVVNALATDIHPVLSQPGDDRPLTNCALSADGSLLATSSWSSTVKVWGMSSHGAGSDSCFAELRGHSDRVMSSAWHPAATHSGSSSGNTRHAGTAAGHGTHAGADDGSTSRARGLLVTGSVDCMAKLWRVPDRSVAASSSSNSSSSSVASVREIGTLAGHAQRLSSVGFHPSGAYVATTSFDTTWRLWDTETCAQLLLQEGHTKEVYALAFHPDGSLVATGDLGGLGRVWDLRSGKSIFLLRGHVKQLLSLDFSPNGHHVVSGSDDHTCTIWELRQQRTLYTIPAHAGLVSRVK